MKSYLKSIFEQLTSCKLYRNSLPRGTNLVHDLKKLSSLPINEIWDVGAHKGETTLYFAHEFPKANIRSFEPISGNYNLLIQNCKKLENHNAHNFALGHENTKTKIYLQDASVIHSLRDDLNKPSTEDSKSEEIEVRTIDDLIPKFSCKNIDLLKIDVEGYEPEVLEGASNCLKNKNINFIYLETGLDLRFNSIETISKSLRPYGYHPYGFYEQTAHWTGKQSLWYWNTLFVKEDLL